MRDDAGRRARRRSVAAIAGWVAAVCALLVIALTALAIGYVLWQTTPGQRFEAHGPDAVTIVLEPGRLAVAAVVLGVGSVLAVGAAAWLIARRAVRPLDAALRVQRRFVADASHELRTPLTVLSARVQQLAAMTPVEDPRRALVDDVHEDTRFLAHIVDDLLLAATAGPAPHSVTSLTEAMAAALRDIAPLADTRDVRLDVTTLDVALAIGAVPLRRCLGALLDNAIAHSPAHGVVAVRAEARRDDVRISVSDRGAGIVGIDPDRVFERFSRGAPTRADGTTRPSAGLGLAIARDTARRYGGDAALVETSASGSTFELRIPVAPDEES